MAEALREFAESKQEARANLYADSLEVHRLCHALPCLAYLIIFAPFCTLPCVRPKLFKLQRLGGFAGWP